MSMKVSSLTRIHIYERDALQFLQDGHYLSELGNTMPLAMANALGVSLVILTSIPSSPVFFIGHRSHTSDILLHLAYTSLGTGHYDGLVLKESNSQSVADATICRCGVNSKHNKEITLDATITVGGTHHVVLLRGEVALHHVPVEAVTIQMGRGHLQGSPNIVENLTHGNFLIHQTNPSH